MSEQQQENLKDTFMKQGYLVIPGFASQDECSTMREEMRKLVSQWDGKCECTFATDQDQLKAQGKSDYFLDSAQRIHFFLERDAINADTGNIRDGIDKLTSLNKVGHGLHIENPVFRKYANSDKVYDLVSELGWKAPVLPQSMYIFKNPGIGGEVTSHQDSSFLFTEPRQTCLGLWLALHDATTENGCLWAKPGSHIEPVRRQFKRNPEYFENGNKEASQMIFVDHSPIDHDNPCGPGHMEAKSFIDGENVLNPEDYGFVPVPVKAGDLFVIHGQIDHMSLPNTSTAPRETFQLHLIEGPDAGVTWSKGNWLQCDQGKSFPKIAKSSSAST